MNRLQKKCLLATTGFHLLLVVILFVGPGFFTSKPKPDDTQVLDVIPANLIDAAFSGGVKNATPPPPTPIVKPPEPVVTPTPTPEPPKPEVKHEPIKPPEPEKLSPEALTPVVKPKPIKPHEVTPDLKNKVTHTVPKVDPATAEAEKAAREAAKEARRRAAAFAAAAHSIKANSSSATTVDMPGPGSVSYANYVSVVKSIYEQAWTPPDDTASDDAIAKVSVTISRDGAVISSRILNPSGDASVDRSVQRTLDRVTFVAPFPDGAKEKERTFIINFNLKAKRLLG